MDPPAKEVWLPFCAPCLSVCLWRTSSWQMDSTHGGGPNCEEKNSLFSPVRVPGLCETLGEIFTFIRTHNKPAAAVTGTTTATRLSNQRVVNVAPPASIHRRPTSDCCWFSGASERIRIYKNNPRLFGATQQSSESRAAALAWTSSGIVVSVGFRIRIASC